jgi:beta-lactamase regulating signal transducer with metallopeptidase domain
MWRAALTLEAGRAMLRQGRLHSGISLVGVFRPRILVADAAARELTSAELDVALAHERAHGHAADNLKRFLMRCAPDVFGETDLARRVEEEWRAASEALADARAVSGDARRALHLASALVKVARSASPWPPASAAAAWSRLHEPPLLELRIHRLVAASAPSARRPQPVRSFAAIAVTLLAVAAVGIVAAPGLHQLTERLVRLLP